MGKKEKIILIIIFIVTLLVVFFSINFVINSNSLKRYSSSDLSFSYDNNWSISKKDDNIYLVDKNGSTITISVTNITDDIINMSIEEVNSSVISKLMSDNNTYKKIVDQNIKITSVYYDGYKTLLENDKNQALVFVTVTSDYVLIINYTAVNKYFDLGLDSVENIVGSIAI